MVLLPNPHAFASLLALIHCRYCQLALVVVWRLGKRPVFYLDSELADLSLSLLHAILIGFLLAMSVLGIAMGRFLPDVLMQQVYGASSSSRAHFVFGCLSALSNK
jgi:hypothetical protein